MNPNYNPRNPTWAAADDSDLSEARFPSRRNFLRLGAWGTVATGGYIVGTVDDLEHPVRFGTGIALTIYGLGAVAYEKSMHKGDIENVANREYQSFVARNPLPDQKIAYVLNGEVEIVAASALQARNNRATDHISIARKTIVAIHRGGKDELIVVTQDPPRRFTLAGYRPHEVYVLDLKLRSEKLVFEGGQITDFGGQVRSPVVQVDLLQRRALLRVRNARKLVCDACVSVCLDTGSKSVHPLEHFETAVVLPDRPVIGKAYDLFEFHEPDPPNKECLRARWKLLPITETPWLREEWQKMRDMELPVGAATPVVLC